jgi:hypothetical protein
VNWEAIAAIAAICAASVGPLIVYGKLTERVSSHHDRIGSLETTKDIHERRLTHVEIEQAKSAEWRKGYQAGAAGK